METRGSQEKGREKIFMALLTQKKGNHQATQQLARLKAKTTQMELGRNERPITLHLKFIKTGHKTNRNKKLTRLLLFWINSCRFLLLLRNLLLLLLFDAAAVLLLQIELEIRNLLL